MLTSFKKDCTVVTVSCVLGHHSRNDVLKIFVILNFFVFDLAEDPFFIFIIELQQKVIF